ncbi:MAG: radical SAM protein [Patescibacteria group bacterium]|nr:radical SAM protein [Patescibacteria group bacterium]
MEGLLVKLLITPVDFDCNMNCGYCYNGSARRLCEAPNQIISEDTIYRIFDQIVPFLKSNQLVIIWHGGEPLLAGQDFYKEALKIQKQAVNGRYQITNCIQTNGTLVDESWADLFAELKIGPSVSVDGPAHLHDSIRTFINGGSTYDLVMRGYRLFQVRDINTGMLMVISQNNVRHPEEIWNWVVEQQIPHFDFLPCIEPELWRQGKQKYGLSSEEVANFFVRFFDLWFDYGDPGIKIRTFRDAIKGLIGGRVNICSWKAGCLQHISFDASGNVFPCARYHCYPETALGNIQEQGFSGILESKTTKWVHEGIAEGQAKCIKCKWNAICGSGCPFLKYALHGNWSEQYVHCQPRQVLFNHVQKRIFKQ